jgi:hypothetical protein
VKRAPVVLDEAMSSPTPDEPHAIADTQVFRRFVEEGQQETPAGVRNQKWLWILIAVVVFIAIGVGIALLIR